MKRYFDDDAFEVFLKDFDFLFEKTGTALALLNSNGTFYSINKMFEEAFKKVVPRFKSASVSDLLCLFDECFC